MSLKWLPLMCALLSACSDKQSSNQNKYLRKKIKPNQFTGIDFIHQQEAKHSDIPIPLNAFPIPDYFNQNNTKNAAAVMGYTIPLSTQEVTLFYTLEMERLGWQQVAYFDNLETLLSFEKPGHICTVSIRPCTKKLRKNKQVEFLIFTGLKEIAHA
jgi:hypothetical protein